MSQCLACGWHLVGSQSTLVKLIIKGKGVGEGTAHGKFGELSVSQNHRARGKLETHWFHHQCEGQQAPQGSREGEKSCLCAPPSLDKIFKNKISHHSCHLSVRHYIFTWFSQKPASWSPYPHVKALRVRRFGQVLTAG